MTQHTHTYLEIHNENKYCTLLLLAVMHSAVYLLSTFKECSLKLTKLFHSTCFRKQFDRARSELATSCMAASEAINFHAFQGLERTSLTLHCPFPQELPPLSECGLPCGVSLCP